MSKNVRTGCLNAPDPLSLDSTSMPTATASTGARAASSWSHLLAWPTLVPTSAPKAPCRRSPTAIMGDSLEDNLQTALSNQLHHLLQAGAFNAAVTLPTASGRTMRKRWPSMQWSAAPLSGHRWRLHRSEEHTSELQSRENLVCRLLLEKKNK